MDFEKQGYKFSLIDNPLQEHCVAWERTLQALETSEAKPHVARAISELSNIKATDVASGAVFETFKFVLNSVSKAIDIINNSESVTLNSHRSAIVKAAIQSGWLTSDMWLAADDVDKSPSWVVRWAASEVAGSYNETQQIPNA